MIRACFGFGASVLASAFVIAVLGCDQSDGKAASPTTVPAAVGADGGEGVTGEKLHIPIPADLEAYESPVRQLILQNIDRVKRDSQNWQTWRDLAYVYLASESYQIAVETVDRAIEGAPAKDAAKLLYHRALALNNLMDRTAAVESLRASIRKLPRARSYGQLGVWLLEDGDIENAKREFDAALRLDNASAIAIGGQTRIDLMVNKPQSVIDRLEGYLSRAPENTEHFARLLGTAYRRVGRYEDAAALTSNARGSEVVTWNDPWRDELEDFRPGLRSQIRKSIRLSESGQMREAITVLEALLKEAPNDVAVLSNLGQAYRNAGLLDRSIGLLEETIDKQPEAVQIHYQLAVTRRRKANMLTGASQADMLSDALESIDTVLELSPTHGQAYGLKGNILFARGDADGALAAFENAARCERDVPDWIYRASVVHLQRGNWRDGIALLERVVELNPRYEQALFFLGSAYADAGQCDSAESTIRKAVEIGVMNPVQANILSSQISQRRANGLCRP